MSDDLIDTAMELLGFAEDIAPGLKFARIAFAAFRGSRGSSGSAGREKEFSKHEQFLNHLIQVGAFDTAESYVKREVDVPDHVKESLLSEIRELQRKLGPEIQRRRERNTRLNELLRDGRTEDAVSFVESLGLPWEQKREVVDNIRKAVREREEKRREAEGWVREINNLLRARRHRKARKYVQALPVNEEAKNALLKQIPKPGWFW